MFKVKSISMLAIMVALIGTLLVHQGSAHAEPGVAPQVGDCTNSPTIDSWTLVGSTVDCYDTYTGYTVYVGTWTSATSPSAANDLTDKQEAKVQKELSRQFAACGKAAEAYLGSRKGSAVRASLFVTNGTGPDAEQWAAGERWFRCEIVAEQARDSWDKDSDTLIPIPAPDELKGYLSAPYFDATYDYCIAENPKTKTYFQFKCGTPKVVGYGVAWMTPEGKYPGNTEAAFAKMRKQCLATMRKMSVNWATNRVWVLNYSGKLSTANFAKSRWLCGGS